jgi:type IV fimbrial biogenesis protein FimT
MNKTSIPSLPRPAPRAFTLIEMMVVIALMGVIILLVAPNMTEVIGMRRLRAINDQLATDIQYMRSEAVSRNQFMGFVVRNISTEPMSCYAIFSNADDPLLIGALDKTLCNCTNALGSACTGNHRELRSVQIPRDLSIELRWPTGQSDGMALSPINGALRPIGTTLGVQDYEYCIEVRRSPRGRLRTSIGASGRPSVCSPDGSVPGVPVCPAYDATIRNCKAVS